MNLLNLVFIFFVFRFLDVSQANQTYGMFECPDTTLANLVMNLPNLTSLDISGTNLSGDGTFDEYRDSDTVKTINFFLIIIFIICILSWNRIRSAFKS